MNNGAYAWDKNKEKTFVKALDNVSFEVKQGELVAIIAPVGVGKVLLQTIIKHCFFLYCYYYSRTSFVVLFNGCTVGRHAKIEWIG